MAISQTLKSVLSCVALVCVAAGVTACGVRGPLDPPTQAKVDGEAKSAEAGAAGENSAAKPKPHEPFVLDGLLR
ncbi:MAG TPA: lipoprotein [Hyphomicrobium sp.]|nr:lipoprotein [Hyphomicrobium sp.]